MFKEMFSAPTGALEKVRCVCVLYARELRIALKVFLQHSKESRGVLRQASKQAGRQASARGRSRGSSRGSSSKRSSKRSRKSSKEGA